MVLLAGIVLHSMLIAAQQRPIIEFRVTKASVSYEAHETNLGSALKTVIGQNDGLSINVLASPEHVQAKLMIDAAGFKTDKPMRDWSVKTLYLKSGTYPEITFEVLNIDGEPLSKILGPAEKNTAMMTSLQDMTVDILVPDKGDSPLVLRAEAGDIQVRGKLKEDILNALHGDKGEIHVTGRLSVAGGSKDFDTTVSFNKTGNNEFAVSAKINARFTDFGMTAPTMPWFIEVHNDLILRGHAVIDVLK